MDLEALAKMFDEKTSNIFNKFSDATVKDKYSVAKELEKARASEKWNQQKPQRRPDKVRMFEMFRFAHLLEEKKNNVQMARNTFITGNAHTSMHTNLANLKPIKLSQMQVPFVHSGHFLACRTITEAFIVVGTSVLIEDTAGDIEDLTFYNFSADLSQPVANWLKPGTIMLIKEPYLKYAQALKVAFLRVQSPSDVIFVHETDKEMLERANALCWYKPEHHTFEQLKSKGNQAFGQNDFEASFQFYQRALKICAPSNAAVIHSNLAITLLNMERFYEAYGHAQKALEAEKFREKSLLRLAKAAYGMRDWPKAIGHCTQLIGKFPECNEAKEVLVKAKARQAEATTGKYEMAKMFEQAKQGGAGVFLMDAADYYGPVKVAKIAGKGNGLITTKPIKKGTLLLAEKAYAVVAQSPNDPKLQNAKEGMESKYRAPILVNCFNLMSNNASSGDQLECIVEIVQKLKRNAQTTNQLYQLYSGPDNGGGVDWNKPMDEGIIDTARIERIYTYNAFGATQVTKMAQNMGGKVPVDKGPGGIWLLASSMNHSCLANTSRVFYGDMLFLFALSDIGEGEELTTQYCCPTDDFEERKNRLEKWGFECDCQLCQNDRKDPQRRARTKLLEKCAENNMKQIIGNPHKFHQTLADLVKKMRKSYNADNKFRYQLLLPLAQMQQMYLAMNQPEKALEVCKEVLEAVDKPLVVIVETEMHLLMAEIYAYAMPNPNLRLAKKLAREAFEMAKIRFGITSVEHFYQIYTNVHRLL